MKAVYTFPGEGDGCVREIVSDLIARGYDGGFSIEPHMVRVFHEPDLSDDSVNDNYVSTPMKIAIPIDIVTQTEATRLARGSFFSSSIAINLRRM